MTTNLPSSAVGLMFVVAAHRRRESAASKTEGIGFGTSFLFFV